MKRLLFTSLILLTVYAGTCCNSFADDWRQWRGNDRDGQWHETGLVEHFTDDSLPTVWRREIASGYSGPTVADGRVFVMDRLTKPVQKERVLCFDAETGNSLWELEYDAVYSRVGYVAGPRASVSVEANRAWALGTMGQMHCLNVSDGSIIWQRDLNADYGLLDNDRMPIWGIAASPLMYQDLVIVHIGGADGACIVALDKRTGEERWRALDDRAQYSSPIIAQQNGSDILVCWTGDSLSGLDPMTGQVHWRYEYTPLRMPIGIATPLVKDNKIFLTSFYDGSFMLEMAEDEFAISEVWTAVGPNEKKTEALQSLIGTPVWIGDHIYGADSFGELRCIRASDGQRVWQDDSAVPRARWSTIHMVQNDAQTWMFNERGELILSQLSPEGFSETCRAAIIEPTTDQLRQRDGVCWSHPAFANRCVYVRNDKELICISLAAKRQESGNSDTGTNERAVDAQAEAVIQRYIESVGGTAALTRHDQSYRHGIFDINSGGMMGEISVWQAPGKFLVEIVLEDFGTIRRGCDGDVVWSIHPNSGAEILEGDRKFDLLAGNALVHQASQWNESYPGRISFGGAVELDGRKVDVIVFDPVKGSRVTRYFDSESGDLVKMESTLASETGNGQSVEVAYSNPRSQHGLVFNMTLDYRIQDGHAYQIRMDEVTLGSEIPDDRFALPDEIQALMNGEK